MKEASEIDIKTLILDTKVETCFCKHYMRKNEIIITIFHNI